MKLSITGRSLIITPRNGFDDAFICDILGLKNDGDSVKLVLNKYFDGTVDLMAVSDIADSKE